MDQLMAVPLLWSQISIKLHPGAEFNSRAARLHTQPSKESGVSFQGAVSQL